MSSSRLRPRAFSGLQLSVALALSFGVAAVAQSCGRPPAPAKPTPDPSSQRPLGAGNATGFTGSYGSHVWLGLRYAKPPKGELRFRAPVLLEPTGSQQALRSGAPCPQIASPFGVNNVERGTFVGDEDCLFLNVYAPHMSAEEATAARLPVMVWFHGGGNVVGHAAGYDGGNLAEREHVVVVMANYRLGPLGWFRHAALREGSSAEDASGNYGTLDQIAALRWVKQHIAGFGGNPEVVTIFGESAGGRDVLALLASAPARGLFARAISESGGVHVADAHYAEAFASEGGAKNSANEALLRLLVADSKAKDAAQARSMLAQMQPAEIAAYLRKQSPAQLIAAYTTERRESLADLPNVFGDGVVIPVEPLLATFARPDVHAPVPVMLGTNRDENKTFMINDARYVKSFTPLYTRMRDPDRYNALAQALARSWKVSGADAPAAALVASGGKAYVYRFDWDEQPTVLGADLEVMLGAGHGMEIPFVFGHFDLGARANIIFTDVNKPGRQWLMQRMMGYWAEFARNGKPGTGHAGQGPEWQPFGTAPGAQRFMIFDTEQGGGVRMAQGALDVNAVLAGVENDKRLPDAQARCAVLGEVVSSSALIDPDIYSSLNGGECKAFPRATSR
ncbi:MAG: carboxylesterase/lipase family protein [Polyangiales bacterium]